MYSDIFSAAIVDLADLAVILYTSFFFLVDLYVLKLLLNLITKSESKLVSLESTKLALVLVVGLGSGATMLALLLLELYLLSRIHTQGVK